MEWLGEELKGARVLDLFSGSGALGLEALSRGASSVDFVENGAAALHALKANRARFKAQRRSRLFKRDAIQFVEKLEPDAYDIAVADPPYTSLAGDRLVRQWMAVPFSRILSIEHPAEMVLSGRGTTKVFGDTAVTLLRPDNRPPGDENPNQIRDHAAPDP
jgi:16S rRNA (guanine966-N2)-methyltransferase